MSKPGKYLGSFTDLRAADSYAAQQKKELKLDYQDNDYYYNQSFHNFFYIKDGTQAEAGHLERLKAIFKDRPLHIPTVYLGRFTTWRAASAWANRVYGERKYWPLGLFYEFEGNETKKGDYVPMGRVPGVGCQSLDVLFQGKDYNYVKEQYELAKKYWIKVHSPRDISFPEKIEIEFIPAEKSSVNMFTTFIKKEIDMSETTAATETMDMVRQAMEAAAKEKASGKLVDVAYSLLREIAAKYDSEDIFEDVRFQSMVKPALPALIYFAALSFPQMPVSEFTRQTAAFATKDKMGDVMSVVMENALPFMTKLNEAMEVHREATQFLSTGDTAPELDRIKAQMEEDLEVKM